MLGVSELLVLYSSIYVGAWISYGSLNSSEIALGYLEPRAVIIALVIMLSLISVGLYNFYQRVYFQEVLVRIAVGFALGLSVLAIVFYTFPSVSVTREMGLISISYSLISVLGIRYIFFRRVDKNKFRFRTLLYGAGKRARTVADLRRKADRRGFKIVGSVPAPGDRFESTDTGLLIRDKPLDALATELDVDEVVIAMDDRRNNLPIQELLNCRLRGVNVIDLLEFLERETRKIRLDVVNPGWLIFSPGFQSSRFRQTTKRLVDFAVSGLILLIFWPILLLCALAIKIEDGYDAPIFYRQVRVGQRGETFKVLKFRSMREDAEADGQAVWADKDDARITRVGAILRKYRLDEFPQVFNVIRGEMSLVGPRPERPEFVQQLSKSIPYYSERHTIKPGITGWAQLNYPYGSSENDAIEKLQYDLYYVKNHNLLLDIGILLQTFEVIFWGKGAR